MKRSQQSSVVITTIQPVIHIVSNPQPVPIETKYDYLIISQIGE